MKTNAFILMVLVSGCSSLQLERDRVSQVKTAAIVGFEITQEMPKDFTISIGQSVGAGGMGFGLMKEGEHVTEMYDTLSSRLETKVKWKIIPYKKIVKDQNYLTLYSKEMEGWRNVPPVPEGFTLYRAPQIIDAWGIERMSDEDRLKLTKSLGVDAIIVVKLRSKLIETGQYKLKSLVGAGDFRPQVSMTFRVFEKSGSQPIWADYGVRGEIGDEDIAHFAGIANDHLLEKTTIAAADKAYSRLFERFDSHEE